jgi:hypothetical protein
MADKDKPVSLPMLKVFLAQVQLQGGIRIKAFKESRKKCFSIEVNLK